MSGEIVFESEADQHGFTQFPNIVLKEGSITPQAKTLYALLRMYAWQSGGCYPGQQTLAEQMGVSDRSVRDYLRELEEALLIHTERRGSTSNRYVLLALGLWAKRRRDRNPASGRVDRNPASDQTGTLLPTKKTQEKKTQKERGSAPARPIKVSGKPVKKDAWLLTADCLAYFNLATGRHLRLLTSAGQPSEAAKRIYGRVVDYPDLTIEDHQRIIANTLASKWWGEERESVGVIYGPKVFEDNITRRAEPPKQSVRKTQKQANADRREARLRELGVLD